MRFFFTGRLAVLVLYCNSGSGLSFYRCHRCFLIKPSSVLEYIRTRCNTVAAAVVAMDAACKLNAPTKLIFEFFFLCYLYIYFFNYYGTAEPCRFSISTTTVGRFPHRIITTPSWNNNYRVIIIVSLFLFCTKPLLFYAKEPLQVERFLQWIKIRTIVVGCKKVTSQTNVLICITNGIY